MNKYHLFLSALISVSLLSVSCASVDTAALKTDISAAESTLPKSWQTDIEAASRPQSWQTLFNDPLLSDYLEKAETSNLDLEQSAARVRQSEARLRQSQSLLVPSVSAGANAGGSAIVTGIDGARESFGANVSASWDPDVFGSLKADMRQSLAQFDLQKANAERLRRVVLAQTARAYMRVVEADQQLALARENLSFLEETQRISRARFKAGDIARDDLSLSELEYENAAASFYNQELAAREARRALSLLLGDYGADDLAVAADLPDPADLGLQAVPASLLAARFDVLASRANLAAQLAALEGAAADDWPRISLSGRVGQSAGRLSDLFDPDFYIASLGSTIAANLFDGGRNEAQQDSARAGVDEALSSYKQSLRNAVADVNSAYDQAAVLRRSLASLERASLSANKALDLAEIKYDLGETILLDVLTVQRRVNTIKGARISTKRRLLEAQIDAYLAIGQNL